MYRGEGRVVSAVLDAVPTYLGPRIGVADEGKNQYLPGTYEYRWAGGTWVEGENCTVVTKFIAPDHTARLSSHDATSVKMGQDPFRFTFHPEHGFVAFHTSGAYSKPCSGALYRIGD